MKSSSLGISKESLLLYLIIIRLLRNTDVHANFQFSAEIMRCLLVNPNWTGGRGQILPPIGFLNAAPKQLKRFN